jgi:hypothetical protein
MFRRTLQGRVGRSLAILALAAYGSAGLFGYGLHALWHCDHCPTAVSAEHCHDHGGHGHAGHEHDLAHAHGHSAPEQSQLGANQHDCSICSFLAQAQTSVVPRLALDGVAPLAEAPQTTKALVLAIAGDTSHARGPPLC